MRVPTLSLGWVISWLALSWTLGTAHASAWEATSLSTESVTYCSDTKNVLVRRFDIAYHRLNQSITFAISAAATDPDLNVAARIYANAYGRDIVNTTIYLCDYLQGVLCPLPMINFTGWGTYPIPDEFIREIPSLAWTVPNLEAFARVTLLDNKNGETSACLQATLYNDLSTEQRAVKWVSGGIFIFALLVALVHTTLRYSPSPAVYRWYDLLYLFQSAAISGLLEINYPLMYIKFVLNFHWAIGLFYDKNIQQAIVKMRNKTGAKLATVALQALDYTNRKLSPYNERYRRDILPVPDYDWHSNVSVEHYDTFSTMMSPINFNTVSSSVVQVGQPIDTPVYSFAKRADIPTVDAKDVVVKNGLPVFTNSLGIPPGNAFATIFIIYMISICVFIGAHILWGLIVFGVDRFRKVENRGQGWLGEQKRGFWSFCLGNLMRLCLIFLFPIFVFALYQFDIGKGDSWLCILLSVLSLAWTVIGLSAVLIYACLRARPKNNQLPETSSLYTDYSWYNSAGMIYRQYRPKYHFWWYAPLAVATFVKACFVAFANGNPWAQVCGLIVVEFLVVVTCIGFRPHKDKKGDWLGAVLGLLRMVAFGLMIAFIPSMDVDPIVRTVLGFVILALFSIPVVLLFFGLLFNLAYGYAFRRHKRRLEDGTEVEWRDKINHDMVQTGGNGLDYRLSKTGSDQLGTASGLKPYDSTNMSSGMDPDVRRSSFHPSIDGEDQPWVQRESYGNMDHPPPRADHLPDPYGAQTQQPSQPLNDSEPYGMHSPTMGNPQNVYGNDTITNQPNYYSQGMGQDHEYYQHQPQNDYTFDETQPHPGLYGQQQQPMSEQPAQQRFI